MPPFPLVKAWTPEEDEQLRLMMITGVRPAEIAIKLKRSESSVRNRARAFGLSFKRVKAIRREIDELKGKK
jgi:hypothetical protein